MRRVDVGKARRFKAVLRAGGCGARDALCIGDELRDLDSARAAGIPFGAVTWGYTHGAALRAQKPEHLFETFDELFDTIAGTTARS